jgi:tRNA-splicing ligase RtcB
MSDRSSRASTGQRLSFNNVRNEGRVATKITVYGDVDARAVQQLERCAEAGDATHGVLCADGHVGYSQPIGGAVAYADYISPSGVGYDIACGNKAVRTNLLAADVKPDISGLMDSIYERISFGVGRKNNDPVDHAIIDAIREAEFAPQRQLLDMAAQQLGTVGSGNHFVDLFEGDDGHIWIGVHFGSRGFGHKTASGFLALAEGKRFEEHAAEGEMDSPPILFHVDSDLGQAYIAAMSLAGEYAYAGRNTVVAKVLEILGAESTYEVHNHHNFAWRENHGGTDVWVIRKGCTPAFLGQAGFVGATMGEQSVILEGVDSDASADLLYSTVHGAGRVMSRTRAAGKSRKRWACNNRECDWFQAPGEHKPADGNCPACGHDSLGKRMIQIVAGEIDWDATKSDLIAAGVELRGAGADEAPGAYKRLDAVLGYHAASIRILHRLTPIGVAMAGADTFDPYKD